MSMLLAVSVAWQPATTNIPRTTGQTATVNMPRTASRRAAVMHASVEPALLERALLAGRACSVAFVPPTAMAQEPYAADLRYIAQVEDPVTQTGATVYSIKSTGRALQEPSRRESVHGCSLLRIGSLLAQSCALRAAAPPASAISKQTSTLVPCR
jgi:hypothetical protein